MDELINSMEKTELHCGDSEYQELKNIYNLTVDALKNKLYSAELLLQIKNKLIYYLQNISDIDNYKDIESNIYLYLQNYDSQNYVKCLTLFTKIYNSIEKFLNN